MAAKNLARTVIEGGRDASHKIERYGRIVAARVATRTFVARVRRNPDLADAVPAPTRQTVPRSFADKLNPAYRFLDSRVGKSWDRTLTMLKNRFDDRVTRGRHLLHDHLLREVRLFGAPLDNLRPHGWYVDRRGILRESPPHRRKLPTRERCDLGAVGAWMRDRKIGQRGECIYWFVRVRSAPVVVARWEEEKLRYRIKATQEDAVDVAFRQDKPLSRQEVAFFGSLPRWTQGQILAQAPSSRHGSYKGAILS
jgi:hypothetical protein